MDKKRAFLNVVVSIFFYVVLLLLSFVTRRFLIQYLGINVAGLNSLYLSLIGFLSVAELGIGSAITFSMYKPILEKDIDKVAGLYNLFKKLYFFIGIIITVGGIILIPFLSYLAKDYSELKINLYTTFLLMLLSTIITYFYSAKISLINAFKENYITTSINSISRILCQGLQITSLIIFKSFEIYLACRTISGFVEMLFIEFFSRRTKKEILQNKSKIDDATKKEVSKSIKAMFMHKIGTLLVNTADNVIISAFIGVVILGKYSNYITIMSSMIGLLAMFFTPLTSVIGHMCKEATKETISKYFNFIYMFSFAIGLLFFLGYYAIIDELVTICFGKDLELAKLISFVITINYFVQFLRKDVILFRDATGTFYYDRWKPLAEGVCNVIISIIFVLILPEKYNVVGVIVATIITNLFICHIVEPHILFKYEFRKSAKKYYVKNYFCIAVFVVCLFVLSMLMVVNDNVWIQLLINGFISVGISVVVVAVMFIFGKDFRYYAFRGIKQLWYRIFKMKTIK
ncbi:MAG: hypothetical protein IJ706_05945 [Clostridia bacterium]|nr:hypothetical protein [Clostridia bacterium]